MGTITGPNAPKGSVIRMAYERTEDGFCIGVIYPNGDPWVYTSTAATEEALLNEYKSAFPQCIVEVISIEEHNQIKANYSKQAEAMSPAEKVAQRVYSQPTPRRVIEDW